LWGYLNEQNALKAGFDPEYAKLYGNLSSAMFLESFAAVTINGVRAYKNLKTGDIISESDFVAASGIGSVSGKGAGKSIKFGSDTKSVQKLSNQMTQRGWTESTVRDTVSSPYTTRVSTNKATGNPATVYYNKAGGYAIIDDTTKAVVQVSDNINPSTWIPDPSIINPYKPWLENVKW